MAHADYSHLMDYGDNVPGAMGRYPPTFSQHHTTPCAVLVLSEGDSIAARIVNSDPALRREVYHTFMFFVTFGDRDNTGHMNSACFMKFCRELRLLSKDLTSVDVDLIFVKLTKHDGSGRRTLNWPKFLTGLYMLAIARWRRVPPEEATRRLLSLVVGHEV